MHKRQIFTQNCIQHCFPFECVLPSSDFASIYIYFSQVACNVLYRVPFSPSPLIVHICGLIFCEGINLPEGSTPACSRDWSARRPIPYTDRYGKNLIQDRASIALASRFPYCAFSSFYQILCLALEFLIQLSNFIGTT